MNRDERIETYYENWGAWDMAEKIVDLEDSVHSFMDLDDSRCRLIKKLNDKIAELESGL